MLGGAGRDLAVLVLAMITTSLVLADPSAPESPDPSQPTGEIQVVDGSGADDPFTGWRITDAGTSSPKAAGGGKKSEGSGTGGEISTGPPPICKWTVTDEPASSLTGRERLQWKGTSKA